VNPHVPIGRRSLAKRARVEVRLTATNRIGLLRYRLTTPGTPDVSFLCMPPGEPAGAC
jgi:hypothetical protein